MHNIVVCNQLAAFLWKLSLFVFSLKITTRFPPMPVFKFNFLMFFCSIVSYVILLTDVWGIPTGEWNIQFHAFFHIWDETGPTLLYWKILPKDFIPTDLI